MKNLPIVWKFLAIMGVFGIFSIGTTLYSGATINQIDSAYSELVSGADRGALNIARANRALQSARAALSDLLISNSDEGNAAAEKEFVDSRQKFSTFMDNAIAALPENAQLPAMKVEGLEVLDKTCATSRSAGAKANNAADNVAAQNVFLSECQPRFPALSEKFTVVANEAVKFAESETDRLSAESARTYYVTLATVIAGLLVVLLGGYASIRVYVVKPIRSLSALMSRMAEGDLSAEVAGVDRRDEVGEMSRSVDVFRRNGLQAIEASGEAARARAETDADRARVQERDRIRANEMAEATAGLAAGLKHVGFHAELSRFFHREVSHL